MMFTSMLMPLPTAASSTTRIAPLRREHLRDVGAVFAASHAEYPSFRFLFPAPRVRAIALRALMTAVAGDAIAFGTVYGALDEGRLLGVAIWLPSDGYPWSFTRKLSAAPAFLSILQAAPRSFLALMQLGTNAERTHPAEPHWYLEAMGVRPEAQGRGLGTRLLQPALARADADRLPCYLETAREENLAFYARAGFEVVHNALPLVPGGPTHWGMRRPALGGA